MTGEPTNPRLAEEIDENLRRVFHEMQRSDLPDRFTNLLDQLRQGESQGSDVESSS